MKILVIGGGGREHALAWKIAASHRVETVFCAPGSAGMDRVAQRVEIETSDIEGLARLAADKKVDLTLVGPEAPLVAGIADCFAESKLPIVGPSKAAAQLEGSKVFAKSFMQRYGIPTARFEVHDHPGRALASLEEGRFSFPVVIKADGLAAGKGVIIPADLAAARDALNEIMAKKVFGAAGEKVVLEEYLKGVEASFMVFTDGESILQMAPSQDHKAVYDSDRGPNTGGMGAFSNEELLDGKTRKSVIDNIIRPAVRGMSEEGHPYRGVLYAGLMLTAEGPKTLEFNVRFGDPETQAVLPRLETELVDILEAITQKRLSQIELRWAPHTCVCVVLTSGGYPGPFVKGYPITGLSETERMEDIFLFHSGTRREGNQFLTNGGRVLGVTSLGDNLSSAIKKVYTAVNRINFERMHFRRDIGMKG